MYDSHRSFVQRKITFSRRASPNYALSKRRASPAHMSGARGWGLSRHSSFIDTTNINKNQQRSTESAKVSKSQQKSAKSSPVAGAVSKSQHFLLRFVNRVERSSEPTALLEHKGVCHRWVGNELQVPLAN